MAVIALPNISPRTRDGTNAAEWTLGSLTAAFASPLNNFRKTLERPGAAWGIRLRYDSLFGSDLARMQAFLAACRGQAQRFYVPSYASSLRGSFPATELFTNNLFASGTTGWSSSLSVTISASDGILRAERNQVTGSNAFALRRSAVPTVVQYAPYAARFIIHQGSGSFATGFSAYDNTAGQSISSTTTSFGIITGKTIPLGTSLDLALLDATLTGITSGDFVLVSYASLARCALVDNGLNALLFSDAPTNAAWTKTHISATAFGGSAPDGATDCEGITEDGATDFHYLQQTASRSSTAEDLCAYGFFKRRTGTRNIALQIDDGSSNGGLCVFDMGAGTAGTPSVAGTGTNARAFIESKGDGWYRCSVIARCPASTSIRVQALMSNGSTLSYAGDGSSSMNVWQMGAARIGVPTCGATTTSSALASGTSQTGSALKLKGLPASTSGLLLPGDPAEVITSVGSQFVRTAAPLNSDAAGLGYWQFEPPLRNSPADNAVIVIQRPLCRMLLDSNSIRWTEHSGGFSDLEFTAIEDTAA